YPSASLDLDQARADYYEGEALGLSFRRGKGALTMAELAKAPVPMGVTQYPTTFEEIFERERAEHGRSPSPLGTPQSLDEGLLNEDRIEQSEEIMGHSFAEMGESRDEVKDSAQLEEENGGGGETEGEGENEGGVTEPPLTNLFPADNIPRSLFGDRSYPETNLPMSHGAPHPSGSQTLSVPATSVIPPSNMPNSTLKPSAAPSRDQKVYISLPQTQQSSALAHRHTQARLTPYCGVPTNEITRPPEIWCSFDDLMDSPYSCARCGTLIRYARSMRRHFVSCVATYGNPHGLRWVDYGDYNPWFLGETGGTIPSLVQGTQPKIQRDETRDPSITPLPYQSPSSPNHHLCWLKRSNSQFGQSISIQTHHRGKMCCWPFVDVVLEDPPPKPVPEKEYHLVSDKLNLAGLVTPTLAPPPLQFQIIQASPRTIATTSDCFKVKIFTVMSFYYNYTGPYPGTLRAHQANQVPAAQPAQPAQPVNPWLAEPPAKQADPAPKPQTVSTTYLYCPRNDSQPATSPKAVEPPAQITAPYQPALYAGHPLPEPTKVWFGATKAEVDAQNAALAQHVGAYKPMEFVPANPGASQQFYCRELDGAYTLRTVTEIETTCQPGTWHKGSTGYPYYVRHAPA
ncbi:MAG: hypothetical protein Q9183_003294, partial [Haloplaca sp. 2 TL-2023]